MTQNESVPPATNPEPPSGWSFLPDNWEKFLQWVKNTFGLRGFVAALIIVVLFLCWWQWPTIRTLPGVGGLLAWFTRKRLKKADPKQFSVGIAMLEGDVDGAHRRRLFAAMEGLQGVQVLPLDRTITREGNDLQAGVQAGHEQARRHLQKCGAHVLIWGTVLKHDGRTAPKLYWTASQELRSPAPMRESYLIAEDLSLPELFWEDLAQVLQLVVAARAGEFTKLQGTFIADRLKPLIAQVRGLLDARPRPRGWTNESIAEVRFLFAGALYIYGQQTGRYEPVEEAVAAYREALTERTRERVPLDWARTQNNLGAALSTLGKRESGTGRLEQAVAAYREALKEYTRERVPLDWAATLNNLGVALSTLGERESGTARSEEAVGAYREALKERTRDRVPLDWAATQSNLGAALTRLGERESGTERLEEAVAALREALKERTRERVPLDWLATQNNLGTALSTLGGRESGTARLEEAVRVFREAMKESTRERVPLNWAMTQNNLGAALTRLGERESGTARSEEAVAAHREALKERTRDRVPLDWAMTQSNLGNALSALGVRESGTARLEHGVAAYREALKEFTRERVPLQWAGTQNNLGNALCSLGKLESGTARLEESVAALRDALQEYTRERVPLQWATTQYNLGLALREFGLRTNQPSVVCEALECFLSARRVFREASHDGASNAEYGIQTILSELHERFDDRTYQECYSHHAAELREIPGGRNPE